MPESLYLVANGIGLSRTIIGLTWNDVAITKRLERGGRA
jgi:hypothetical protein